MPRKNDVGVIIRLTITKSSDSTALDISAASTKTITIKKPGHTSADYTASLTTDGTDGKMQYAVASGVLDEIGLYEVQGYVKIGSTEYSTTIKTFSVEPTL